MPKLRRMSALMFDHIMVFNLPDALKAGQKVVLVLVFDNGEELTVELPVHKEAPEPMMADKQNHKKKEHSEQHKQKKEHKNH